jgi:hypothetical protein
VNFSFLLIDEGGFYFAHHLPVGFAVASVLASMYAMGCRLVEDKTPSITLTQQQNLNLHTYKPRKALEP